MIAFEGTPEAERFEGEVDAGEFRQFATFGELADELTALKKTEDVANEAAEDTLFEEDEQAG